MAGLPSSPFWEFSLAFYARPEVAHACLALQDRHGADVNLVLLAIWLGRRGHYLSAAAGGRLQRLAHRWQRPVIGPLRRVRRELKRRLSGQTVAWPEALVGIRRKLADAEITLEKMEQLLLEEAVGELTDGPPDPAAARHNLALLGLPYAVTEEANLLLEKAFPACTPC